MATEGLLEDIGCECIDAAHTVERALALIEQQPFDAAMLDINLTTTTSYPVADALGERGIPFFFATGYSDLGIAAEYQKWPVLRKPLRQREVADLFLRLLGDSK